MSVLTTVNKVVAGAGDTEPLARAAGGKSVGMVDVVALSTNTGDIQIGGADMDGTTIEGIHLAAGEHYRFDNGDVDDLVGVYVYAENAGEGVSVTYSTRD